MFRNTVYRHDVRKVDFRRCLVGKLDLRFLGSILKSLKSHRIFLQISATILSCEFLCKPVDNLLVEVITAKMGITIRGFHFEHTVTEFHDGNIECATTEVEHSDFHILIFLVKTISKRSCSRLVDDTLYIETRDLAGFLGSLTL